MKILVLSLATIVSLTMSLADAAEKIKLDTPQKRAAYAKMKKQEAMRRLGGMLLAPVKGKVVRIVNKQNKIPDTTVADLASRIAQMTTISCEVVNEEPKDTYMSAIVRLVDKPEAPSILVAPENFWSELNVSALSADNPGNDLLIKRFKKEFFRAFFMTLGAGNSVYQPCLMCNVSSLKELDAIKSSIPCPQALDVIQRTADTYNFGRVRLVTYQTACKEGWAPAPTNDVQKAIWEKVHAIPQSPMKIEFDPKKGR